MRREHRDVGHLIKQGLHLGLTETLCPHLADSGFEGAGPARTILVFILAPRINAIGRLGNAVKAIKLLFGDLAGRLKVSAAGIAKASRPGGAVQPCLSIASFGDDRSQLKYAVAP